MTQTPVVDVVLDVHRHRLALSRSYVDLLAKVRAAFPQDLPFAFRLYYRDPEGDLISVTTQEDLDIAYVEAEGNPDFQFLVYPSVRDRLSRRLLAQSFSSAQTSLILGSREAGPNATVLRAPSMDKSIYVAETDFPPRPRRSDGHRIQEEDRKERRMTEEVPTSVCSVPNVPVSALEAIPRPACEETKAKTKEKAAGSSEAENDDVECLSCNGKKLNKRGQPCRKCNGTGKMNASLKRHICRIIKQEVTRIVQLELERQSLATATEEQCAACKVCKRNQQLIVNRDEDAGTGFAPCGGCNIL